MSSRECPSSSSNIIRFKAILIFVLLVVFLCSPSINPITMVQAQGNNDPPSPPPPPISAPPILPPPPVPTISFACRDCVNTVLSNIPDCQNIPSSPPSGMSNSALNGLHKKCSCTWANLAFFDPTWASKDCARSSMCSNPDLRSLLDQLKSQSRTFQCPAATNSATVENRAGGLLLFGPKDGHGSWKWEKNAMTLALGLATAAAFL